MKKTKGVSIEEISEKIEKTVKKRIDVDSLVSEAVESVRKSK